MTVDWGSSPLARGLPAPRHHGSVMRRIIPARAGFTRRRLVRMRHRPDHPRSRGVYTEIVQCQAIRDGSSPLARGLRVASDLVGQARRIIPARAGFTTQPRTRRCPRRGSSPLARGLRRVRVLCHALFGIIPARAGFTRRPCDYVHTGRDHPRSRGVYWWLRRSGFTATGSSPLARGLPYADRRTAGKVGIIPARAGFTEVEKRLLERPPDHPRSRGVYTT